jgi:ribosomal protein L40E
MKINGRMGPPVGAAAGLVIGIWTVAFEMQGYDPIVRFILPAMFAGIGLLAGFIVWWLDRASGQSAANDGDVNRFCCPRCGRRNTPDATTCIKCGGPLTRSNT